MMHGIEALWHMLSQIVCVCMGLKQTRCGKIMPDNANLLQYAALMFPEGFL